MRRLLQRRGFWVALAAAGVAVGISGESVRGYLAQRREIRRLETRLDEARRRASEQESRVARSTSDAYIETSARRELGLLRPGEIEFRFVAADDVEPAQEK